MFLSPWDIKQRTGITGGAIRHLDVVPGQFLGQRLGYETPLAINLFGTHQRTAAAAAKVHICVSSFSMLDRVRPFV